MCPAWSSQVVGEDFTIIGVNLKNLKNVLFLSSQCSFWKLVPTAAMRQYIDSVESSFAFCRSLLVTDAVCVVSFGETLDSVKLLCLCMPID